MFEFRTKIQSSVAVAAVAMGLLYIISYHIWVGTDLELIGLVPPLLLFVAYLSFGGVTGIWRCHECDAVTVRDECPQCGAETIQPQLFLERTARYMVIVPAGALLVEFISVALLEMLFQTAGNVSAIAWYQSQWAGRVGLFGPLGLFLWTVTAPLAYLFSIGVGALWAIAIQLYQSDFSGR